VFGHLNVACPGHQDDPHRQSGYWAGPSPEVAGCAPSRWRMGHPLVVDDVCTESSDQTAHLVLTNLGSVGPLSEPDSPIFPRGACVPRRQDDVKVGKPVAENKAVDVLGLDHLLQCPRQTVDQESHGHCLRVRQIAQSRGMSHRLGDEITPVSQHRFGKRIGVSGIDQFIFEENASGALSPSACLAQTKQSAVGGSRLLCIRKASRARQCRCRLRI
jgi:hypothetical protein